VRRIVLAHSGGLNTSVAIPWLRERYGAEIVAVTVDLGQREGLEEIRDRALEAGAIRAHVLDVREEFARDYVLPALKAGAIYEDYDPMAAALSRPLLARTLVEVAAIEGAGFVAHGTAPDGGGGAALDRALRALNQRLALLAPACEWQTTRADKSEYARSRGVPAPTPGEASFGSDSNIWGRSVATAALDERWVEPPEDAFLLTRPAAACPDEPAHVDVSFDRGAPVAINGVEMRLLDVIASLGIIAGGHGVGRIDMVANRAGGLKSRAVVEAPAAVALHLAHRELQKLVTTKDLDRWSRSVSLRYADIINDGLWFTPEREALHAFVAAVQERVTGAVRLRFFRGDVRVAGRTSPYALHKPATADDRASDEPKTSAAGEGAGAARVPEELPARKAQV
jgi:argininosuccinate synthase